jgi:hypothetical protein
MRNCTVCKIDKDDSLFVKRSNRKSGVQSYCKECHNKKMRGSYNSDYMKNYDLVKNYNITLNQFKEMSINQNDRCAICYVHILDISAKHKKTLCVDHCHKTGKIRGLLCDRCNRGIGLFKEDIKIMLKAIEYITNSN